MPVLKSDAEAKPFVEFSMTDIEREAAAILEGAKRRAVAMQQLGREQAAKAKQEGYDAGYADGEKTGREAGHAAGREEGRREAHAEHAAKLGELAEALDCMLRTFNKEREKLAARAGGDVPRLAVAVAERVVKRAGAFDPRVCIENSTAALRLVMRAHDVKIAVHPDDGEVVRSLLPDLGRRWPALTHVEMIEDPELTRGGCRVHTEGGLVDADLQSQLDRIARDLVPGDDEGEDE